MPPRTLTEARNQLLNVDTGVNRRLLYLGAGDDVGCSVGLFWNKCDSFYLVDPEYGTGISYDKILLDLERGSGYMSGMKAICSAPEEGVWDGVVPGRRYQIWEKSSPHIKKRLCFARSGSGAWLASTNTRYNVVINKDYAGITGDADSDYPYIDVWDKLNVGGIFCETIGGARSNREYGFAKYRYRGFDPLYEVVTDADKTIGFGDGFWLFQKTVDANAAAYLAAERELAEIDKALTAKLNIFPESIDFTPEAIQKSHEHAGLLALMTNAPVKNWNRLATSDDFANWLIAQLPQKYANIPRNLVFDILKRMRLDSWGSW